MSFSCSILFQLVIQITVCSVSVLLISGGRNVFLLFLIESHKLCSSQRNNSSAVVFFTTDFEIWWKPFPSLISRDTIFIISFLISTCLCVMLILANGRSSPTYGLPGRAVDFVTFRTRVKRATPDRYSLSEKITSQILFIKHFRLLSKRLN